MASPAVVGIRELKTRLGGYLRRVREGRTVVITDRGQPVAELRPIRRAGSEEATLDRLRAIGAVTRLQSRALAPFRPVRCPDPSLAVAIAEGRDDRV